MLISGIGFTIYLEDGLIEVTQELVLRISLTEEEDRVLFVFWLHSQNLIIRNFFYQYQSVLEEQIYLIPMGNYGCQQCTGCGEGNDLPHLDNIFLRDRVYQSILVARLARTVERDTILQELIDKKQYLIPEEKKGIIFFPNLGYYEGSVNQKNKPEGYGELIHRNLKLYKGYFQDGRFHGNGIVFDTVTNIKFEGTWSNGLPKSGILINSVQNGRPTFITSIETINSKNFKAQIKLPNGIVYQGSFVLKNKAWYAFQGKGLAKFPDGSSYDGEWFNGKMQGQGKYTWDNGDYYEGHYENGMKCGQGVMFWSQQNKIFQGQWFKGQITPPSFISSTEQVEENQRKSQNMVEIQ